MQDPRAIVAQARSGHIPETWRVIHPIRGYPAWAAARALFLTFVFLPFAIFFVVLLLAVVVGIFAIGGRGMQASAERSLTGVVHLVSSYGFISVLTILVAVLAAIIAFTLARASIRAARDAPYSLIIFTPDSLVQSLAPHSVTALDFAAIDEITRQIVVHTTTSSSGMSSSSTATIALLHNRDGRSTRWRPDWRFGPGVAVVERLISAHQRYRARVGSPGRG